jgi:hypothetical protein
MNKKFELLREAVGCYKANHCSGITNEKELLEFISELEQLNLSGVSNCVFVVTERDNYGEQLFKDVFENKEQAIEFLAKDGLWESNIHEINEIELN